MSCLVVTFEKGWLEEERQKGIRVVRDLEKLFSQDARLKVTKSSSGSITVEMKPSDRVAFLETLAAHLQSELGIANPWEHAIFSGDVDGLDIPKRKEEKVEETPFHSKQIPDAEDAKVEAEEAPDPTQIVEALCKEVPMRYSSELADYMRDTASVIPMLQKMGVMSSFWRQGLLLSIDDGCGRSDFLKSLAKLYDAFGLLAKGGVTSKSVCEIRIEHSKDGNPNPYEEWENVIKVAKDMNHTNSGKNGISRPILCLDISEWQSKLTTSSLKNFLRQLNAFGGMFTYVFRIPFVEASVLRETEEALNDILNVRPISVPPVPLDSMTDYVRETFQQNGFELAEEAGPAFEQWILREKGDDSFFGYKTLDKMVQKSIYEKALANCRSGTEDRVLTTENIRSFGLSACTDDEPVIRLDRLIGLDEVKTKLQEIIAQIKLQKELALRGSKVKRPAIHMLFTGNPGTGKTTVARIAAHMLKQEGVLRKGHLFEIKGRDLCGRYVGQTAPKTSALCRDAYGSVLFIDEAYSLFRSHADSIDYGREALDTLVAEMENHRDDLCVIFAGYKDEMETMLEGNIGLESRIPYTIEFPNYSRDELEQIFFSMMDSTFEYDDELRKATKDFFSALPDEVLNEKGFSNARLVRNLYERVWGKAAYRRSLSGDASLRILKSDFDMALEDREFKKLLNTPVRQTTIGFGK
ncbi:MAG: AAA family ATPase [Kiritimatiellae bacterium]|nr:AAA family ATPase [Kiritimatiellia bacterium]